VGIEHALEAAPVRAAGHPVQATPEPADPPRLDDDEDEEHDDGDEEAGDGDATVRLERGVEIDLGVLRRRRPSLAGATYRRLTTGRRGPGAILSPAIPFRRTDQEDLSPVMAKRVRGSSRPTGRRPANRPARPAAPRRPEPTAPSPATLPSASLTAEEEARAAALEERIVTQERAAEEALRRRNRARGIDMTRSFEPLSVRAAGEYAYVRRDVIRFARVALFLLAILAVLFVLIDVTHTITF
jgi:hypothetical protein